MKEFLLSRVRSVEEFPEVDSVGFLPRDNQLQSCSGFVRRQRQCAWLLLGQLLHEVGLDEQSAELRLLPDGKWTGNGVFVSLSHCDGFVAAAVSSNPVGIDVEPVDRTISTRLYTKIATLNELALYGQNPSNESLLGLWTAKEAAFKASDGKVSAAKIDTTLFKISTDRYLGAVYSVARLL